MESDTLQTAFTDVIENLHLAKMYAKRNCRHCYGRGVITRAMPTRDIYGNKTSEETLDLCYCVKKALKKEAARG